MLTEVPDRLPCGCLIAKRIVNGEKQVLFQPCGTECEFYEYMVSEALRLGSAVEGREGVMPNAEHATPVEVLDDAE